MAVNLGTRGLQEACDLVEYANHPAGTYWSDRRIANGAAEPFGIKLWCLGNELDGPWQVGHKTAAEYGRLANETGKAMRLDRRRDRAGRVRLLELRDADLRRVGADRPRALLRHRRLRLAARVLRGEGRRCASFLASALDMDQFIESVVATADAVGRAAEEPQEDSTSPSTSGTSGTPAASRPTEPKRRASEWQHGPRLIEDEYSVTDAVVVGTLLNSLLRHGDRVTVACQAQLVNVIGLLRSEPGGPAWKQTIAYPFEQMRRLARGQILHVVAESDRYDSADYTDVPLVDTSATYDAETGRAALFVAHRGMTESATFTADLRGVAGERVIEATSLHARGDQDRHATNRERHDAVGPEPFDAYDLVDGQLTATLPPLSWTVFELAARRA